MKYSRSSTISRSGGRAQHGSKTSLQRNKMGHSSTSPVRGRASSRRHFQFWFAVEAARVVVGDFWFRPKSKYRL
ncbi:hypothetical protein OROHE_012967 [Orobanche hederae]